MAATPWEITADKIVTHQDSELVEAEGDVVLNRPGPLGRKPLIIKADKIIYDGGSKKIKASGNLIFSSQGDRAEADSVVIGINNEIGSLINTTFYFADTELYFSGSKVEKTGPQSYRFLHGRITACKTEDGRAPAWSIWGSEANLTIDGFATIWHATLRVKDFPILYTPFLIYPAKTKRQTGFLFPEISHSSRDGYGFMLPLFINLSPSSDLTLYPGYLVRRGFYGGLEYRYVANYRSLGSININYLNDRTADTVAGDVDLDYRQDGYLRTTHDRYWVRSKVDHYFTPHSAARFDLDFASDRDFIQEYRQGMIGFDESHKDYLAMFNRGFQEESLTFRESNLQFAKEWNQAFLGLEGRYVDDTAIDATAETSIHTLPRLMLAGRLPIFGTAAGISFDSEYVNYWRRQGLGYNRLDVFPRLAVPLPLGALLEGKVSSGFRETIYQVKNHGEVAGADWSDYKNRNVVEVGGNIAAPLSRDFEIGTDFDRWLNHTFRPNLKYSYTYSKTQKDLPDLDADDRLGLENLITYEFNNYFILGSLDKEGSEQSRDLGHINMSQGFNVEETRRQLSGVNDKRRPFSEISFDLDLYPLSGFQVRYQTGLDVYGKGVTRYDLLSRYANSRGDSLALDYTYNKGSATDLKIDLEAVLLPQIKIKYHTTQSLLNNHKTLESLSLVYTPHCWSLEVEVSKDTNDQRIMVLLSLAGIGKAVDWGKDNI